MRAALLALALLAAAAPTPARAETTWLCKPGLTSNPCDTSLDTARFNPDGTPQGTDGREPQRRRIDCFYVYPTVSGQQRTTATKHIDPELRSIAQWQAARYSSTCRVFAPVYRQVTLAGLSTATDQHRQRAYRDVRAAWRTYLRRHNDGRGVVLIGHSQGTFHLRELLANQIEPRHAQRRRIVSAVLLGGNAATSDFARFRPCRSPTQTGCVIAFSAYNGPVPPDALFGRGDDVICTNPAALDGDEATIDAIFPRAPFAPGTAIATVIAALGSPIPASDATWLEFPDAYTARCAHDGGAHVLQVTPAPGAPALNPVPTPGWGLHLADANLALGDLEALVRRQAAAYLRGRS
jgi:Protein of unknown function (DUF3089)